MKVVINRCFGGFGLSDKAKELYKTLANKDFNEWYEDEPTARHDLNLIKVVEQLGSHEASDTFANLEIVEIPDNTNYVIEEYDGSEWVSEAHRTWR